MFQFTKFIQTSFGNPLFSFTKIFTLAGERYYVFVRNREGKIYSFAMEQKGVRWFILNPINVHDWVIEVETELAGAISEYNDSRFGSKFF
ncbi:MAG: hypothetical protein EOO10_08635 [Chitinophagaceae bacterium]|nr:MAG: hypothetical protein EOO10_08635 [Chitinophagaceae bacterium]